MKTNTNFEKGFNNGIMIILEHIDKVYKKERGIHYWKDLRVRLLKLRYKKKI